MAPVRPCYMFVQMLAILAFMAMVAIMVMMTMPIGREIGLTTADPEGWVSWWVPILPPTWFYQTVWIIIFIFQFLWLCYAISTTCRKNTTFVEYLYAGPNFLPPLVYAMFMLGAGATVAYHILFDRGLVPHSLGVAAAAAIFLWMGIGVSFKALKNEAAALVKVGYHRDIDLVRCVVHNGLALFAMWCTLEVFHILAVVLKLMTELDPDRIVTIIVCLMGVFLIIYVIVDLAATDVHSRNMISPYLLALFLMTTTTVIYWEFDALNSILAFVFGVFVLFGFIAKLIMLVGRYKLAPKCNHKIHRGPHWYYKM